MKAKRLNKTIPDAIHFTLAKSDPLDFPSKKKYSFIFCPWKEFRTHVSKIVWLFSNSLFFCVAASQNWFLARTPVCTTIESLNLTAFVEGAETAIVELTELSLATSCKIYLAVPRQNMETSFEIIFIPAWSEETLPFDLNLHIKNSPIYQIGLKKHIGG